MFTSLQPLQFRPMESQLKAIYKDNADTIIGNMDTSIFLGGKEPTTLKEMCIRDSDYP